MKLLDKPYTIDEKIDCFEMMNGNVNRVCVSDDIEEIVVQLGFAIDRLSMIAYSRIKELKEKSKNELREY